MARVADAQERRRETLIISRHALLILLILLIVILPRSATGSGDFPVAVIHAPQIGVPGTATFARAGDLALRA